MENYRKYLIKEITTSMDWSTPDITRITRLDEVQLETLFDDVREFLKIRESIRVLVDAAISVFDRDIYHRPPMGEWGMADTFAEQTAFRMLRDDISYGACVHIPMTEKESMFYTGKVHESTPLF